MFKNKELLKQIIIGNISFKALNTFCMLIFFSFRFNILVSKSEDKVKATETSLLNFQFRMDEKKELVKIENENNKIIENKKKINNLTKQSSEQQTPSSNPNSSSTSNDTSKAGMTTAETKPLMPNNKSIEEERRFRSEAVRKNWKIVLDMAMKKRQFDFVDNDNINSFSVNTFNHSNSVVQSASHDIYASDKENWIYFSIILAVVIGLSILFCYLVYSFFPHLRNQNF